MTIKIKITIHDFFDTKTRGGRGVGGEWFTLTIKLGVGGGGGQTRDKNKYQTIRVRTHI